jgi:cytochrome c
MSPPRHLAVTLTLAALAAPAAAGSLAIGVGTQLTPSDLAGMASIPPDGTGLPSGEGSVSQGASVYSDKCVACHGENLQGVKAIGAPALIGGRGTLASKPLKTVESYWPYATTLFDYIRRAMPMNAPGSLTNEQVYAVSAFILARAHIIPADAVMDARTLPKVIMPNRQGFVPNWKFPNQY